MKLNIPTIHLEERDLNSVYNLLGQSWRSDASDSSEYDLLIAKVTGDIQNLCNRAFMIGVNYGENNEL